ncbi:Bifunctional monothiol glutaredoxin-S16, chloroplastic [Porphyridium purpureum]|uniref:Bifunctional monothiol glutaredoxin-S16, chloroplastic n=1 Tax=Porphyridium purpureum TaxID=35688 RepID=A0A5J4Z134_PORPP|nr:Bifunctional monothiol glutaredoxin-S16, chloroplastic [Porphyridium purpureum]|eukprot:POR9046..scf208_2
MAFTSVAGSPRGCVNRVMRSRHCLCGLNQRTLGAVGRRAYRDHAGPGRMAWTQRSRASDGSARLNMSQVEAPVELESLEAVSLVDSASGEYLRSLPEKLHGVGCYAIFDRRGELKYIEISRMLSASIMWHMQCLGPDECHSAKVLLADSQLAEDEQRQHVQETAVHWIQGELKRTGRIPEGNDSRFKDSAWRKRPGDEARNKPPLTFPPDAKPEQAMELLDRLVKAFPVILFLKGTRTVPQCGFSDRVCEALDLTGVQFETVDVLDEGANPGLREALTQYSQWPTVPQVFVNGQLLGGCDVVESYMKENRLRAEIGEMLGMRQSGK